MKTETLHFIIDGPWLTDHVRNLWTEGRQDFAIHTIVVGLIDMTEGQAVEICTGKKKLIGDSEKGIFMVQDKTKMHRGMKLLTLEDSLIEKDKENKRLEKELRIELGGGRYEPKGDIALKNIDDNRLERTKRTMDDFIVTDKNWANVKYGWIDKEGNVYDASMGCGAGVMGDAHLMLEDMTGISQKELEAKGWIKITLSIIEGLMVIPTGRSSKAQKEKVAEFCEINKIKLPSFWED